MQLPIEIANENLRFDSNKIIGDIRSTIFTSPDFDNEVYSNMNQISLRSQGGWFGGIGSLYDDNVKTKSTEDYNEWNPVLDGTYLKTALEAVEQIAALDGKKLGRARIMRMMPKTCLTLHVDPDEHRYHIPLETNHSAFFVVGTEVLRMPITGVIYRFKTNIEHTAVNASMKIRIHLVFDTY